MGTIRLKNMQFYGFHGVDKSEKHLGGRFEVDVEMKLSLKKSCNSDELDDTVNYEKIYKTVDTCVNKDKFYLIEALANSIAKDILINFPINSILVRVRKPHAPVKGVLDTIEVELNRSKEDYV
ncbi:MAG: dihydroneopterin aldolase [Candidatus Neomarinimicrobiota bacterium]|nr:dihydroneopterin aldolase [Candidatus Neomarinimicrobiota bacterium]MEC9448331.1 dihydroneopterin aldolase [Candidatus Neomarinimicrobiota bacterium]|tara:strand:+ start:87 stop:455 length:369 start_codon:yes stop_codon:yes gene_type:complete